MAGNLRGLTEEMRRAGHFAGSGRTPLRYLQDCISDVLEAKKALLKRSEMLEFVDATDNMSSVGGLDNLKRWLQQRRSAWDDGARAVRSSIRPKGVIILGVQGLRQESSVHVPSLANGIIPLVKFDTAAIYDKFIGETEKRIQKVFKVAEGLAPCVLWIDGIGESPSPEAAPIPPQPMPEFHRDSWRRFFPGCRSARSPVFVAATCNNVHSPAARVDSQGALR